jgi:hypothetical protein
MSESKVRAQIVDLDSDEVIARCVGADEHGDCPRVPHGDTVPCAGHLLIAEADRVQWRLALEVGHFATKCPLRGFSTTGTDCTG